MFTNNTMCVEQNRTEFNLRPKKPIPVISSNNV